MSLKTAIDAKALAEARRAALDAFMDEGAGHDVVLAAITTYLETLWQPIEGAPKDGRLILVATNIKHRVGTPAWTGMYCAYWDDQDDLWKFHREGHVPSPTHWQPLPCAAGRRLGGMPMTDKTAIAVDAKALEAIKQAGAGMANILYNVAQSSFGTAELRQSMKDTQSAWDRARDDLNSALPHAGKVSEDDPELDGTDAAHPAWWRGNDRGCEATCEIITRILDGEVPSGVCREPLETVRRRVAALSSQHAEAGPGAQAFDPMNGGCPHCKWLDTNLGRVLDQKCTLHQKIEDLQAALQMERQISRDTKGVLRAVCEVIRADDDDNPVEVAKERMAEIEELEAASSPVPAYAESGIKARVAEFAQAILHGDEEHRGWLIEAAEAFNSGAPLPEPRGKGTNSAIRSTLIPTTSPAKGGADGPIPAHECEFSIGQPVRLAHPYPEMDPDTVFYITGISWEHRMVPAHGWNIEVATKEDIQKGYGQTDGYRPVDLSALRTSAPVDQQAKEGGE